MKLPINKVPALAAALSLEPADVFWVALQESSPDLISVIEEVFNPLHLTISEMRMIRHLRNLAGDRPAAPIVFDGKGAIALVTA